MIARLSNDRVKGFLRAEGRSLVNGDGEEIVLCGWGLGNWLLPEGYMWKSDGSARFDRPRRIEAVIRELTGSAYTERFWERFRSDYVTREDIRRMAEQGYNSVRIPFNWRILMEDEPGIVWKEEGFRRIDRCLDWCEEFRLYAFLDLHGAPGGQTGHNIDDSVDDVPRLFTDEDSWNKGIALWRKLAERYKDRWIVGGYDLLNEPIRPPFAGEKGFDHLVPRLVRFYEEAIAAIREIDGKHLLSIEGHHWATKTDIFHRKYDGNMVIHFHRYACLPEIASLKEFIELSERWNVPLWLGETGENVPEWYAAFYPLSLQLNIGINLWPWKKMDGANSPYSIRPPEGWNEIIAYAKGGPHPGFGRARAVFDEYLHNVKVENCAYNPEVTHSVFRTPGCSVRATDFDELPGKGVSFSGRREEGNPFGYRALTGMRIVEDVPLESLDKRFFFDVLWDRFVLELEAGEFAVYAVNGTTEDSGVSFVYGCESPVSVSVFQDERKMAELELPPGGKRTSPAIALAGAGESKVKIAVNEGILRLEKIAFGRLQGK
ncbi:glycoside hydrolase family 5 protein [Cohnella caldifontis]|uniref:glycoside hydrolase family 5 protein n=1 Tax=Cohnella caldifontis TaxID=3027471 RepID=UPI0023EC7201|nr:cellulase family glycosylhydrolase [Cohnella sp. YIM B05605]